MKIEVKNSVELLAEKIQTWYEISIKMIPNIALAFLILLGFILLAKLSKNITRYLVNRVTTSSAIKNLATSVSSLSVLVIGVFISLEVLNLEKTVTSLLAGAGVIGLALGFAFQEIASNFVSGVLIAFRKPYQIDDIIEMDEHLGKVEEINLRTTRIRTFQGLEAVIPNKYLFTKPFINYTTTPERRMDIEVGVGYESDLKLVEKITKQALEMIEDRLESKEVEVYFKEFGASSINLSARVWIKYPKDQNYLKARHNAIIEIKSIYDENNINIPFPIRTLINQGENNEQSKDDWKLERNKGEDSEQVGRFN